VGREEVDYRRRKEREAKEEREEMEREEEVTICLASTQASYEVLAKSNFDSTVNVFEECVRYEIVRGG
jgi:hypothetical protein